MGFSFWVPGPGDSPGQGWEVRTQLANLCWETCVGKAGQCFFFFFFPLKKPPQTSWTSHFFLLLPAQIPASAQWDFGQERARFSPKAPVLQLHIYLQKRPVRYPCAGRLLGNGHKELEYLAIGLFQKPSINFLFLLVDGFIICSEIRAFFACKPGAPTNGRILCQFPSMLDRIKESSTDTSLLVVSPGRQSYGFAITQLTDLLEFSSPTSSEYPQQKKSK